MPVNVTVQLPETRVHGFGVPREPVPVTTANSTVPAGVLAVPAAVSVTVAVHVEAWLMNTGVVHETPVEVVRLFTVIVFEVVGPLPAWTESDAEYVPLTVAVPLADGVKETLQLPETNVHGLGVPRLPVPVTIANRTVPAGVLAVPAAAVSLTVAVHVEAWLTNTGVVQLTAVDVVRRLTVIVLDVVGPLPA